MGLLTEKYKAWAKHPNNCTAEQVLNQIVADLEWLDKEQENNSSTQLKDYTKWLRQNNHLCSSPFPPLVTQYLKTLKLSASS